MKRKFNKIRDIILLVGSSDEPITTERLPHKIDGKQDDNEYQIYLMLDRGIIRQNQDITQLTWLGSELFDILSGDGWDSSVEKYGLNTAWELFTGHVMSNHG